jgi:hypothetical protein
VVVGETVYGGFGFYSASMVARVGDIGSVDIRGGISNYLGDVDGSAGTNAGSIAAARYIGSVKAGFIEGDDLAPVRITAGGVIGANDSQAMAIRSIVVEDTMSNADILAGYSVGGSPLNPDVQIGAVAVGVFPNNSESGNLYGTNIVAGAVAGPDGIFGTFDDALIDAEGASAGTLSRILSINIAGAHYSQNRGFVAEEVRSIVLQGEPEAQLTPGARNDFFTFDVHSGAGTNVSELRVETPRVIS